VKYRTNRNGVSYIRLYSTGEKPPQSQQIQSQVLSPIVPPGSKVETPVVVASQPIRSVTSQSGSSPLLTDDKRISRQRRSSSSSFSDPLLFSDDINNLIIYPRITNQEKHDKENRMMEMKLEKERRANKMEKSNVLRYFSDHKIDEEGVPLKMVEFTPHNFRNKEKHPEILLGLRAIKTLTKFRNFEQYYKLHAQAIEKQKPVRKTPSVPISPRDGMNVEKFLKSIGRGCEEYVSKFTDWNDFVLSSGIKLKEKEIPIRQRRYMLDWIEKYRQGMEPKFMYFRSITRRNKKRDWRTKLYTQKDLREKYEVD